VDTVGRVNGCCPGAESDDPVGEKGNPKKKTTQKTDGSVIIKERNVVWVWNRHARKGHRLAG